MTFGESFLECPDLFPGRHSGETWGEREVLVDVAGGPYLFRGLSPDQERQVLETCEGMCDGGRDSDSRKPVETCFFRAASSDFRDLGLERWSYRIDIDAQPETVRLAGYDFVARLDWVPEGSAETESPQTLVGAVWTPNDGDSPFRGLFANYLRVLAAYRLLEQGGALFHSAAVLDRGDAYLFLGPSGAGKSTISKLGHESGRTVLSDGLNALHHTATGGDPVDGDIGRIVVEKMPFAGDFGRTRTRVSSYPVKRILRLRRAASNSLRPMRAAEALALFLACSPFVNQDPHRHQRLMSNLEGLLDQVPTDELAFSLDGRFWDLLDNRACS